MAQDPRGQPFSISAGWSDKNIETNSKNDSYTSEPQIILLPPDTKDMVKVRVSLGNRHLQRYYPDTFTVAEVQGLAIRDFYHSSASMDIERYFKRRSD